MTGFDPQSDVEIARCDLSYSQEERISMGFMAATRTPDEAPAFPRVGARMKFAVTLFPAKSRLGIQASMSTLASRSPASCDPFDKGTNPTCTIHFDDWLRPRGVF
jgi:hypothetical protein